MKGEIIILMPEEIRAIKELSKRIESCKYACVTPPKQPCPFNEWPLNGSDCMPLQAQRLINNRPALFTGVATYD